MGILGVVLRRVSALVVTVLIASAVIFVLMRLIPGDPAAALVSQEGASPQRLREIHEALGLNDPIPVQYVHWLERAAQGDLDTSFTGREPVTEIIIRTLPKTIQIVFGGLVFAVLIGVPLGIVAAIRANTRTDASVRVFATIGLAIPHFWLGLLLVGIFALGLGWFPATGFVGLTENFGDGIRYLVLPSLAVGLTSMAAITRQTRSAMLEVLSADFIRTLRAAGLREQVIIWRHALKNSSIPLVTIVGLDVNRAISGAIVIEAVFGIQGIGNEIAQATLQRDFPVIQGVMLTSVLLVVIVNLILDLAYLWIDPRTRAAAA